MHQQYKLEFQVVELLWSVYTRHCTQKYFTKLWDLCMWFDKSCRLARVICGE